MSRTTVSAHPFLSHPRRLLAALLCMVLLLGCAFAEDSTAVPQLVKFSGTIAGVPAGTVSVIFALHKDQTGGAPLWQEVQNLAVDASGHYTSLLGARSATGIPVEVFSNGEARWLGVVPEGRPEQPRVLLVSVPYALKASDAETLGGLPASAFLRAVAVPVNVPPLAAPANYINSAAVTAAVNSAVSAAISVSSPTLGYVPYFYDASGDLKNSSLFQAASGNVGIGTTTPAAMFTLVGTNPSIRLENYSNTSGDSPNFNFYTGRGTATTPLATQSGDNLGQFASAGYNGAAFPGSKVKVTFLSTENWTATANGTAMTFATTTNGTTARAERMRIDNSGNVGIGTATPAYPLTVAGTIQSTTGGFRFPDNTTQTTAAAAGIALTSPDSSITVAGSAAAPTVKVNTSMIQQRVSGTCASGSAISSIGSTGTVACQAVGGGGGIPLPVTWSGAAIAPAGVLNVTDTANGPVETLGSLPNANTVPAAIVGTATGTGASLGVLGVTIDGAGISGFASGTKGFGVFASSINSISPALYAGNFLTGYVPTGLAAWPIGVMAHVSNAPGIALEADAVATSSPACAAGTKECYGVMGVNSDVFALSGPATVFHGHAYSTSANGLWLDFYKAPTSGTMIRAGVTSGGPSFVVDGSANVTTTGDLHVGGTLSKASGTFKIDHPLDPANKYLSHSFVESPDMMNIYNGNIVTDRHGNATVELPSYFEALNQDFRYQLTVIGQFAQAIVVREIAGNHFTIKTSKPAVKVSWQVTGVRHDAYAEAHRVVVEEAKPEQQRGTYLHPELFHATEYVAEKN